jgi:hypothetical protein
MEKLSPKNAIPSKHKCGVTVTDLLEAKTIQIMATLQLNCSLTALSALSVI